MAPLTQDDIDAIEQEHDPDTWREKRPIRAEKSGYQPDRQAAKRHAREQERQLREQALIRDRWPR